MNKTLKRSVSPRNRIKPPDDLPDINYMHTMEKEDNGKNKKNIEGVYYTIKLHCLITLKIKSIDFNK